MQTTPLVTIGIPVFNGAKYINETLRSINNQSYKNIEIIIVDDGSKDNSFNLCSDWSLSSNFPVSLIKNASNLGVNKTCNTILKKAKGKYFHLFGQDDFMLPGKIESDVLSFENQNENVAFLFSRVKLINHKSEFIEQDYFDRVKFKGLPIKDLFIELTKMNFIPAATVMTRTCIIKKLGGYDETLQFEDWDMWLRLSRKYEGLFLDITNSYYRIHEESLMANRSPELTIIQNNANIRMFKKYLGFNEKYDVEIYKKLKELSIYSYFIGDDNARNILQDFLKKKFDFKIWIYHKLSNLGVKHHSRMRNRIIDWVKRNK